MDQCRRHRAPLLAIAAAGALAITLGGAELLPLLRHALRAATVLVQVPAAPAAAPAPLTIGVRG